MSSFLTDHYREGGGPVGFPDINVSKVDVTTFFQRDPDAQSVSKVDVTVFFEPTP